MKLQRVLEGLSKLSDRGVISRGVVDEGRIFSLGVFENEDNLHGRVKEVLEGLRDHVGQPFDMHQWAFTFDMSTYKQDGVTAPMSLLAVVQPLSKMTVLVREFMALPRGLRPMNQLTFNHTADGTTATVANVGSDQTDAEDRLAASLYPLAIAILNTRGCSIDFKSAPGVANSRRKRQGKPIIPARYDVDASEYVTALRSSAKSDVQGATHSSPIPHLRRAHERVLSNEKRVWVRSALVNVRAEGDIAFVERRKAYQSKGKQQAVPD